MDPALAGKIHDVVVYGGIFAGVMSAVQAKRMGKSVVIVCPDTHLGGLSSSDPGGPFQPRYQGPGPPYHLGRVRGPDLYVQPETEFRTGLLSRIRQT